MPARTMWLAAGIFVALLLGGALAVGLILTSVLSVLVGLLLLALYDVLVLAAGYVAVRRSVAHLRSDKSN